MTADFERVKARAQTAKSDLLKIAGSTGDGDTEKACRSLSEWVGEITSYLEGIDRRDPPTIAIPL
jgi:hypothetical protein